MIHFLLRVRQAIFSPIQKTQLYMQPRMIKGEHALLDLVDVLKEKHLTHYMIVTTPGFIKRGTLQSFFEALTQNDIQYSIFHDVKPDPEISDVEKLKEMFIKDDGCQALIAIGGGSAIDCSKAALACVQMKNLDVKTVLHTGRVSKQLPLLIAVPTTAGTGSEVTAGAVITDPIKKRKYALSHLFLIPKYAVLDSSLLTSLPAKMTAYSGMDALTHAIEAYINCFNNRKTNEYALCAIKSIFQYLVPSFEDGLNMQYRLELLEASYNAGVAISNNYVGYVHAIAHGIGGMYHLQHGMINAIILPIVLEEYGGAVVGKLAKIADVVGITGATDQDKSKQFIQKLQDLNQIFSIPTSIPEIQEEDIHYLATGAEKEGNPTYPTPVTWNVAQFEKVIRKIKQGYTI
ncbi:iron-containing alcohol dehydrogenase [Solobacterium moorei]|uniref:Alcohol dehydrogenase, iron-dependent n=1 Tax=Solobacterium moorei F0204 TaxID=706433 RepID=E7MPL7_9FIRM|nr:iron-containing alcohol dehydrogenase [Solobacterium moorei]EFW23949.1 alcohol dehydrogenase, iron-dependent [Solobacterium moorei F0204]